MGDAVFDILERVHAPVVPQGVDVGVGVGGSYQDVEHPAWPVVAEAVGKGWRAADDSVYWITAGKYQPGHPIIADGVHAGVQDAAGNVRPLAVVFDGHAFYVQAAIAVHPAAGWGRVGLHAAAHQCHAARVGRRASQVNIVYAPACARGGIALDQGVIGEELPANVIHAAARHGLVLRHLAGAQEERGHPFGKSGVIGEVVKGSAVAGGEVGIES